MMIEMYLWGNLSIHLGNRNYGKLKSSLIGSGDDSVVSAIRCGMFDSVLKESTKQNEA